MKNNQYQQYASETEKGLMAHNYLMEYSLYFYSLFFKLYYFCLKRNVKELTDIYTHYYYQVDAENNREEILEDIAVKHFNLSIKSQIF